MPNTPMSLEELEDKLEEVIGSYDLSAGAKRLLASEILSVTLSYTQQEKEAERERILKQVAEIYHGTEDTPGAATDMFIQIRASLTPTQEEKIYPNGTSRPCDKCGDGGHTAIACTSTQEGSKR